MFNMITGTNESKALIKHISCKYKCRFDGRKSNQWWNNNKCRSECKNCHIYEKNIFGILLHVIVKMENIKQVL